MTHSALVDPGEDIVLDGPPGLTDGPARLLFGADGPAGLVVIPHLVDFVDADAHGPVDGDLALAGKNALDGDLSELALLPLFLKMTAERKLFNLRKFVT